MSESLQTKLLRFLESSPSPFHAVDNLKRELQRHGFRELKESEVWSLERGRKYYVSRNSSALISFTLPEECPNSFHIIASHCDSPCLKLKPGSALAAEGIVRLNVEKYGGMIETSWFDRPLSLAGRVFLDRGDSVQEELVRLDRDLLMIPSLSVHFSRSLKEPKAFNIQTDMLPILGIGEDKDLLLSLLSEALGVEPEQILSTDLFVCNREKPVLWGARQEFLAAPKLDDLECCYCSFLGFLECSSSTDVAVHCVFDNEEIGSRSRQGADSDFLRNTLERAVRSLGLDEEAFEAMLARSFLVSADNAHALHPNFSQLSDPVNRPALNRGIVLKYQAEQRYATDAYSAAVFKKLCREHAVAYQEFSNRSDMAGGSTLGSISETQIALPTVDIGLAQWAMHSAYESAGIEDAEALAAFSTVFYSERLPEIS